jgi:hypothetical protein
MHDIELSCLDLIDFALFVLLILFDDELLSLLKLLVTSELSFRSNISLTVVFLSFSNIVETEDLLDFYLVSFIDF